MAKIRTATASFTRPADTTPYTSGDLVADSTAAGSVTPIELYCGRGGGRLVTLRLSKSSNIITLATFSLHLFESLPTVGAGDNSAISHDMAGYLSTAAFAIMVAGTDVGYANLNMGDTGFTSPFTTGDKFYGLLEAKAAYTPVSSEVFTVYALFQ